MTGRTGPVTYGQLSVIRSLGLYLAAGQPEVANQITIWPVLAGATVAHVSKACHQLAIAHESLRTTYDLQGPTPQQIVHPARLELLDELELSEHSMDAARSLAAAWAAEPIAIDSEMPWRAFVATYGGEPVYLVAIIHHIAADNGASLVLETQFGQLLAGEALPEQPQPLELASLQRADGRHRAIEHWIDVWPSFHREDRDATDASARRRASIYDEPALTAAMAVAGRAGVSVQSLLLAVGACVLGRALGRSELTLGLMAANRLDERWAGLVSSLNQCVPVAVRLDPGAEPLSFARDVHLAGLTGYANGSFDVDELGARLGEADPTFFSKHFNYLGPLPSEPEHGSSVRTGVEWRPSTQRSGPNLHLVGAVGQGLLIGVGASERLLSDERLGVMAGSIARGLRGLEDGSVRSVAELGG